MAHRGLKVKVIGQRSTVNGQANAVSLNLIGGSLFSSLVIVLLIMYDRNFISSHNSILDPTYQQHTVNKSIYFCS